MYWQFDSEVQNVLFSLMLNSQPAMLSCDSVGVPMGELCVTQCF